MPTSKLHLISFDVPFPPDYGGVIDVFYKIKALAAIGVKITLHCFEYGRAEQKFLEDYCEKVFYYPRKTNKSLLLKASPYIVISRESEELLRRVAADNDPVVMEGLHCTSYLDHPSWKHKFQIVRTHNIEHDYYKNLANAEARLFKRLYFQNEAVKLEKYENVLKKADLILAISENDRLHLAKKFKNVELISAFHPFEKVSMNPGIGNYVLYHGNLSVGENNQAALFLVKNVFAELNIPFIIAGSGPSKELKEEAQKYSHITIRSDVQTEEIQVLIRNAQINILPTFQATGIKLKLLSALFLGRHCIVNTPMVSNTGLETLCTIADSTHEIKTAINSLMTKEISVVEEIKKREEILDRDFSNRRNAEKLSHLIPYTQQEVGQVHKEL